MQNITIGQYEPGNSWLYKLDPRLKLISMFILFIVIFITNSINELVIINTFLFTIIILSRVSIFKILRSLRMLTVILLMSLSLQIIYTRSGALLGNYKFSLSVFSITLILILIFIYSITKKYIKTKLLYFLLLLFTIFYIQLYVTSNSFLVYNISIYSDAIDISLFIFLRTFAVVILSTLLTLTTNPNELNTAIEDILKPIPFVPHQEIAFMMSIVLRMIPTLLMESEKILKAQSSRGVDFNEGSIRKKVKQLISVLIPLLVLSFTISNDLANSIHCRGYVLGQKRTRYNQNKLKVLDFIAVFILLIFVIVLVGDLYV